MSPTRRLALFYVVIGLLSAQSCFSGVPHVIQMSIDGLGAVYLKSYLEMAPEKFPNFMRLKRDGAFTFNARCDFEASETIPNHACMFTGRPAYQPAGLPNTTHHGLTINSPPEGSTYHNSGNLNVPYKYSVFDVVHDHGFSTAFFAGKLKLGMCDRSFNELNGALDVFGEDNGRDKIDVALVGAYSGPLYESGVSFTNEINAFVDHLSSTFPATYAFIHIGQPDITGHFDGGWGSTNYSNMVMQIDGQLGRIFAAIESNPVLANRTTFIVMTDHGGGGEAFNAHSNPTFSVNYTIPLFVWGPGIPAGADLYSLFTNRGDPGTGRPDYIQIPQPIRNGDSGNLVLALLGLPSIPGSLMQPMLNSTVIGLGLGQSESGALVLSWSALANNLVLQFRSSLDSDADWETVTTGITQNDAVKFYAIETTGQPIGFYRLHQE
jgi:hypothetical protein